MNYETFIYQYLIPLTDENNPEKAVLAEMRRGLNSFPAIPINLDPYIRRRLPERIGYWNKKNYYLTASLFATHQINTSKGNMGTHFRLLLDPKNQDANKPIERRFSYLLTAHPDDLHFNLRQAVSFLRSKETAINWNSLMWDIRNWNDIDRRCEVQENWSNEFWQKIQDNNPNQSIT